MQIFESTMGVLKTFGLSDAVDILIVAGFAYWGFKVLHEIRAQRLFKGIAILVIAYAIYLVSKIANFITTAHILEQLSTVGLIVMVVVFQPELRRIFERFGRTKINMAFWGNGNELENAQKLETIKTLCDACNNMAERRTGALIVVKKRDSLDDIEQTGIILDAKITRELLLNIFFINTPLHDGAVIIDGDKIYAAGCILPLTQKRNLNKKYGTRHRAGIGISENSDALVLIVSEELGAISVAHKGELKAIKSKERLQSLLEIELMPTNENQRESFWDALKNFRILKRLKKT
ncbi:membrane protein [Clostridia bacterium]|nr:membrane protein [Clostridia bacterium]